MEIIIEDFVEIAAFPAYLINKQGQVYSKFYKRLLATPNNTAGYPMIRFNVNGKQHSFLLHRVLAYVFLGLPSLYSEDYEVDHKNRNKEDYSLDNLQVLSLADHYLKTVFEQQRKLKCYCKKCSKEIKTTKTGMCSSCYITSITDDGITADQIYEIVTKFSWVEAGRRSGLSDNGVRKRFTKLTGLPPKEIYSYRTGLVKVSDC